MAAFVVRNPDYYWRQWERAASGRGVLSGRVNWSALIFNVLWLLYRRMYREFFWAVGAIVLLGMAEGFLSSFVLDGRYGDDIDRVTRVAVALTMGFLGNRLYLRRIRAAIADARRLFPESVQGRHAYLANQGGTSWLAVIIGAVASVGIGFLAGRVAS